MHRVAIVGGCRTAFVKAAGSFAKHSFIDLGKHVTQSLVKKLSLDPNGIEEFVFGTVLLDPRAPNWAREVILRSGLPPSISAHSVSNNCISGLVALNCLAESIKAGRVKVGIAGGAESMSRPALTLSPRAEEFFISMARARDWKQRAAAMKGFNPKFLVPSPPSPKEPSTGLTMGQHCELMAKEWQITRRWQDEIALRSHQNGAKAQEAGYLAEEIAALDGVDKDNIIRKDTTLEKLSGLKPVFDRSDKGTLTAGNSSPLTDGASVVCLMSEEEARRQGRDILGYLEAVEFAAISPSDGLLMAPGLALPELLRKSSLSIDQIDVFEIHEAFGAQVAANILAWERGWQKYPKARQIGRIPDEKINRAGGSIAIGHPFAATGGRLVISAMNQLRRDRLKTAVLSVCAAGAMGAAALIRAD